MKQIPKRLINRRELSERLACTERHTVNLEKLPGFPAKVRIGRRGVRWEEDEIEAWIQSRRATA